MKAYEHTLTYLNTLKLKGIANGLDEMIHDAEIRKDSYITLLNSVLTTEISYRVKRRMERNMTAAHFPVIKKIDDFEFGRVKGIGKSEVVNLLDCRWIDNQENLLFFGPPGVGNYRKILFMERKKNICLFYTKYIFISFHNTSQ